MTNATTSHKISEKLCAHFHQADAALVSRALAEVQKNLGETLDTSLRTAEILADQHAEASVVAAVLLCPLRRCGFLGRDDIARTFGESVMRLVEETYDTASLPTGSASQKRGSFGDLLRAVGADLRVLITRIASRLVALESTDGTTQEKADLARETRELVVPLADRLGMGALRARLEDTCFRILEPEAYASLARSVTPIRTSDNLCLDLLQKKVMELVLRHGLKAIVNGRTKSLWGLHCKMRKQNRPLNQIIDRLGLRVIVSSVPECYTVLGLIHTHFRPVRGTFHDYIGLPKDNGYQSLHTCVYPIREVSAKPVEFQVRTRAMHAEAEFGAAAHWLYKSRNDARAERERQEHWLQALAADHEATVDHQEFVARLSLLVYEQSVVVFLRGGKQVRMPEKSTAWDVIHKVAKRPEHVATVLVNAELAQLDRTLRDGDTVEWEERIPDLVLDSPVKRPRAFATCGHSTEADASLRRVVETAAAPPN